MQAHLLNLECDDLEIVLEYPNRNFWVESWVESSGTKQIRVLFESPLCVISDSWCG